MKKVTMQDIADRLGLTKVSVSKALNGQSGVSRETRAKILETAKQMGYLGKDGNSAERSQRFAMIVPKRFFLETEGFYTEIYYYLNKFCLRDGHQLYSIVLTAEEEADGILPQTLERMPMDGVFLMGEMHDRYIKMLGERKMQIVAVDFYKKELQTDCVLIDNFFLGYSAAQYLLEKGHRKIGFVGNIYQTDSIMDRYFGYCKALMLAGIPLREDWRLVNNNEDNFYSMDIALPQELPTAFVCHCDMAGYYLIESLHRAGKRVPEDVSIISFDNTALSERTTPRLTSFDVNRREIAETAYRCMLEKRPNETAGRRRFISNSLAERDSVREMEFE